jgi:copper(I)-binding protein
MPYEDMMRTPFAAAVAAIAGMFATPVTTPMPAEAHPMPAMAQAVRGASNQGARLIAATAPAGAEYTLGALRISAPWMRATAKGATVAGGYLTVTNTGSEADRLISVASDIAASAEVHEMSMSGGIMTMRPVEGPLEIKPGATLELKPGGYHVMFTRLKLGVNEGDKVKATLVFEKAGRIEIEFVAGRLGATGPSGAMQMQDHKM